jgi:hypothetical protein
MEKLKDEEILTELKNKFVDEVIDYLPFPKAYPENIDSPKAILLGCDPTNIKYNICFEHVFALERTHKEFERFVSDWDESLKAIDLSFETIYTQNLCRNYFKEETGKNKIWYEAADFWIPYLIHELKQFDENIPVLLSSETIYKALLNKGEKPIGASDFYNLVVEIPIPPEKNKLNRFLIPFYRHRKYSINNYPEYRNKLFVFFNNETKLSSTT